MEILQRHEQFEIEMLEYLKNGLFLANLVFGGGTMLRLCYDLNRYSADLDFWFIKRPKTKSYFERMAKYLKNRYEITDSQIKYFTLLFEVRSPDYPKRLKIEIRKGLKACDFQERIAFSKYATTQVILNVLTMEQAMKNKIEAFLDRAEIRDCFDIEFLLRKGVELSASSKDLKRMGGMIVKFKPTDYSVTLGSILDSKTRDFYKKNGFAYLLSKIASTNVNV